MMNGDLKSPSRVTGGGQAFGATLNQGTSGMASSAPFHANVQVMGPSMYYVFRQPGNYTVNVTTGQMFNNLSYPSGNQAHADQTAKMSAPVPRASTPYSSRGQAGSSSSYLSSSAGESSHP